MSIIYNQIIPDENSNIYNHKKKKLNKMFQAFSPDDVRLKFTCMADYQQARLEFIERHYKIAHLLLSPEEYQAIFGEAPDAAIPKPRQMPPAMRSTDSEETRKLVANKLEIYKIKSKLYDDQETLSIAAKNDLLGIMPLDVRESLKEVDGLYSVGTLNKTAAMLLKELDAKYNVITSQTLDKLQAEAPRTCTGDPKSIREVSVRLRIMFKLFNVAGQPFSQYAQMQMMIKTLPVGKFDMFFRLFNMKYAIAEKNFELLVTALEEEAETQATDATNIANAAFYSGPPAPPAASHVPRAKKVVTYPYYCWSHGNVTSSKHNSVTCKDKHPNHDDTATMANKHLKGGRLTDWVRGAIGQHTGP